MSVCKHRSRVACDGLRPSTEKSTVFQGQDDSHAIERSVLDSILFGTKRRRQGWLQINTGDGGFVTDGYGILFGTERRR